MDMRELSAAAALANDDLIKAYLELKKLREDVERIERSSRLRASRVSSAGHGARKGDDGAQGIVRL